MADLFEVRISHIKILLPSFFEVRISCRLLSLIIGSLKRVVKVYPSSPFFPYTNCLSALCRHCKSFFLIKRRKSLIAFFSTETGIVRHRVFASMNLPS